MVCFDGRCHCPRRRTIHVSRCAWSGKWRSGYPAFAGYDSMSGRSTAGKGGTRSYKGKMRWVGGQGFAQSRLSLSFEMRAKRLTEVGAVRGASLALNASAVGRASSFVGPCQMLRIFPFFLRSVKRGPYQPSVGWSEHLPCHCPRRRTIQVSKYAKLGGLRSGYPAFAGYDPGDGLPAFWLKRQNALSDLSLNWRIFDP